MFSVEVVDRCTSTNTELLARTGVELPTLLFAEEQTAGRGRRGRRWHASPGTALMFSLRREFSGSIARLRGLSLAAGVSIARTLRSFGASSVELKWPNDLLADGAKLGGVLIETRSMGGRVAAVIGVGINCRRIAGFETRLKRRIAALEELITPLPARNQLAVAIAAELGAALRTFDADGFAGFRADWDAMHAYRGERLKVRMPDGRVVAGIAEGIAADGALLLRNRLGLRSIASGSVVRAVAA